MQLYANPLACSLASHISLIESGLAFDLHWVDLKAQRTADGRDYRGINPKGMVPALRLDEGYTLTENVAVLLAIADRAGPGQLAPAVGSGARDQVLELLSFIATELHARVLGPWLTAKNAPLPTVAYAAHLSGLLHPRLDYLETQLEGEDSYLAGPQFTVADAYLVPMLTWVRHLKVPLDGWPKLADLYTRLQARPSVQQAMKAELKQYRPG